MTKGGYSGNSFHYGDDCTGRSLDYEDYGDSQGGGVSSSDEELVTVDEDDDTDGVQTLKHCRHDVDFWTQYAALLFCSSTHGQGSSK